MLISATALGDTLFSTPAIRALKERFPAWELEVLAHRVFGALLAHNPHVGRIYTYPGRNRRLLTLARDLSACEPTTWSSSSTATTPKPPSWRI